MAENEWYRDWFSSPFYHKLYFERDENEAQNFIDRLIQHLQPRPGARLVDVGCGKGRHSHYLAQKGYDVTGIDISFESIKDAMDHQAAEGALSNLHFYQHDMRLPFWINYFDYAFNFFTSFGYFRTRREHDDAMRTIANCLKPGGTLMFDYLNVHYVEDRLVHNEVKEIENTAYEIHRWHDEDYFFKRIIIKDPKLGEAVEFTEKVAKFSLGDFTDMLAFQKIQVSEVFGDYSLGAYDVRKTPRMIIVGNKTTA